MCAPGLRPKEWSLAHCSFMPAQALWAQAKAPWIVLGADPPLPHHLWGQPSPSLMVLTSSVAVSPISCWEPRGEVWAAALHVQAQGQAGGGQADNLRAWLPAWGCI